MASGRSRAPTGISRDYADVSQTSVAPASHTASRETMTSPPRRQLATMTIQQLDTSKAQRRMDGGCSARLRCGCLFYSRGAILLTSCLCTCASVVSRHTDDFVLCAASAVLSTRRAHSTGPDPRCGHGALDPLVYLLWLTTSRSEPFALNVTMRTYLDPE